MRIDLLFQCVQPQPVRKLAHAIQFVQALLQHTRPLPRRSKIQFERGTHLDGFSELPNAGLWFFHEVSAPRGERAQLKESPLAVSRHASFFCCSRGWKRLWIALRSLIVMRV